MFVCVFHAVVVYLPAQIVFSSQYAALDKHSLTGTLVFVTETAGRAGSWTFIPWGKNA